MKNPIALWVAVVTLIGAGWAMATVAAERAVAPVQSILEQHLAAVAESRKYMEEFAQRTDKRLERLCRATGKCD